jgi:hypothetical protein
MNRLKRNAVVVSAIILAGAGLAGATIETFEFSGTIRSVLDDSKILDGIDKGTAFKGSYWIDTDKLKEIRKTLQRESVSVASKDKISIKDASYLYRLLEADENAFGMEVSIGDIVFTSGSKRNAQINSYVNKTQEAMNLYAYADTAGDNAIQYVSLSFNATNNALKLKSNPLLIEGVDLTDKSISTSLTYLDYNRSDDMKSYTYGYATGSLDSFTSGASVTPEPGTLAILIFGGGVLIFRHKRKNKLAFIK